MIPLLVLDLQKLYTHIEKLVVFRRYFRQLTSAMPLADDRDGSAYLDQADDLAWLIYDGFVTHNCLGLRKMIDPDTRAVSLTRVLDQLKKHLPSVSRAEFRKANPDMGSAVDEQYDKITGGKPELTADMIDQDIAALRSTISSIKTLVDKTIAHTDHTAPSKNVTHQELNDATDCVMRNYNKYASLLGGSLVDEANLEAIFDISAPLARIWPKTQTVVSTT